MNKNSKKTKPIKCDNNKKYKLFLIYLMCVISFLIKTNIYATEENIDIKEINEIKKEIYIDITNTSVNEIQKLVDNNYLTYEELVKLYIDRVNEYDEKYNAMISINENAIEEAKEKDEEYKEKGRTSILFGIPVILKDNIDYTLLPTTAGTTVLKDSYPNKNATIVQNLLNAGAIIIGKSNMSEFAFSAYTSYSSYGSVRNAFDLNYTAYGSSGGSAVAVSASYAPVAIGTDTNSSIRLPSSAANIIGLRPTYGLLSGDGIIKYDNYRDTAGPMTKTVEDNAILLTILANNGIDYTKYLDEDGLYGMKIGVLTQFIYEDNDESLEVLSHYYDEVDDLMQEALNVLESKGAILVEIDDLYNSNLQYLNNNSIMGFSLSYYFDKYIKNTNSKIGSFSKLVKSGGYIQYLSEYNLNITESYLKKRENTAYNLKEEYREYINDIMEKYGVDVLIYPSTKDRVLTLDEVNKVRIANNSATISSTTGYPTISLPLGFDSLGLAYGFEVLALENREDLIYKFAYSYENATNLIKNPTICPNLYESTKIDFDSINAISNNLEITKKNNLNNKIIFKTIVYSLICLAFISVIFLFLINKRKSNKSNKIKKEKTFKKNSINRRNK